MMDNNCIYYGKEKIGWYIFYMFISRLKNKQSGYVYILDAWCILVFFQSILNIDLLRWLPASALVCKIIFSEHIHEFCDHTHTHSKRTKEIIVPTMTWKQWMTLALFLPYSVARMLQASTIVSLLGKLIHQ